MHFVKRLACLRNAGALIYKRYVSQKIAHNVQNYEEEVKEIFRIATEEFYHSLKQKQLSKQEIANEMVEFRRKILDQQQAMLESLKNGSQDVPTAKADEN